MRWTSNPISYRRRRANRSPLGLNIQDAIVWSLVGLGALYAVKKIAAKAADTGRPPPVQISGLPANAEPARYVAINRGGKPRCFDRQTRSLVPMAHCQDELTAGVGGLFGGRGGLGILG